jgi:hypothetical protein
MPLSPPTARSSRGQPVPRRVTSSREDPCGPSGPARVRSPNRPSQRRSWPSTTRRPRAPRAARRAELRCPPAQHHHCGRPMARIGSDPSRRIRSRTVVHRPVVDGDPDDRAVEQPSPLERYRDAGSSSSPGHPWCRTRRTRRRGGPHWSWLGGGPCGSLGLLIRPSWTSGGWGLGRGPGPRPSTGSE